MPRIACLPLVVLAATIGAVDEDVNVADLRFSLGSAVVPNHAVGYFSEVDPSAVSVAGGTYVNAPVEETYGSNTGIAGAITATYGTLSPLGFLWGGGLRYANSTETFESMRLPAATGYPTSGGLVTRSNAGGPIPEMTYSQTCLVLEAGLGAALSTHWHAEAMVTGSMDWVSLDLLAVDPTSGAFIRQPAKGLGFSYGARLGFYWTDESRWQYGLGAAWTRSRAMLDGSFATSTVHMDVTGIGLSGYGSIGYRF